MAAQATTKQLRVLRFIAVALEHQGYPPSRRELAAAYGTTSFQGISQHLDALIRKGLLERTATKSHGTRITNRGYEALGMDPPARDLPRRVPSTATIVQVARGWRCPADGCGAQTFDASKPCPMCALNRKVA